MSHAATADSAHEHDDHGHAHEVASIGTYLKVYGALLVLTVITVGISFLPLGGASFAAAMVVAVVKASVVAAWFMHLKQDDKLYTLALVAGCFFIALFFLFTYLDLFTRELDSYSTTPYERQRDVEWEQYLLEGGTPAQPATNEMVPADAPAGAPAADAPNGM